MLTADFARLGEQVEALEAAGADLIHWDVMDGSFVPNLTFGATVIAAGRRCTSLPFEAHLMVVHPERSLGHYVDAGCERLIVHTESTRQLHRTLGEITRLGAQPCAALNPATPVTAVDHVLDLIESVLVMTVNPGFGGQPYLSAMERKVAELAARIDAGGHDVTIGVDGGIGPSTVAGAVRAGATSLVAGSALFTAPDGLASAVADLRARAEAARP